MKDVYAKAVKQSILDTDIAFRHFFNKKGGFPKFAKKNRQSTKMYFVKNDKKHIIVCERHRIKIPTLGWVQVKEKGYIPIHDKDHMDVIIKSGTISQKADRYYISVLVEQPDGEMISNHNRNEGIGIDLGIKDFAVCSNGTTKKNINKSGRIRNLEKQLKREQRKLSRKYESEKKRIREKECKKGEATRKNIQKQVLKVQKIHQTLANIRNDYQNKIVDELVKTKPAYITIEDLNVKGMMKNKHLSKAVKDQSFYTFRNKLEDKCRINNIELRVVNRFYPSSKTCHQCKEKKVDLKLSDRIFHCDKCGHAEDRDFNASLNLRDAKEYKIVA